MFYDPREFVNREPELNAFINLLNHRRRRILLFLGAAGIGKSCVVHQARQVCSSGQMLSALIDFGSDRTLSTATRVMGRLREQIGGVFDERLHQVEVELQRDFNLDPELNLSRAVKATVGTYPSLSSEAGGGVSLSRQVEVEGDVVGKDKITISNSAIILNPADGPSLAQAEIENRRNSVFRAALTDLMTEQRLVLFFDQFEKATQDVDQWLRHYILEPLLTEFDKFSNLWVVIAGQKVPFQNRVDQLRHLLSAQHIGPLHDEAIQMFWVDKRELDPAHLPIITPACGGNPQLLCLMANNFEAHLER